MDNAKPAESLNKHQAKTAATLRSVLDAAEKIFVRDGYERAQIEAIAAQAGRTKGAVYAHFHSKEDIFFALIERKANSRREAFLSAMENDPQERHLEIVRELFLDVIEEENWPILLLEFKLFALRNKDSLQRVRELYRLLYDDASKNFFKNVSSEADKDRLHIALAILRGISNAVALEKQFNPVLNSRPMTRQVLGKVFDVLIMGSGSEVQLQKDPRGTKSVAAPGAKPKVRRSKKVLPEK
ncbi:TetR/AcrR family transcriptional regulator [Granulicella sp. WH15]|uniref:TetR/AcrR family transcriptional regulator n=1 Tax=Granulicella sp. WH15 TaxID=2602070 RepID=UPI0013670673|nr:TetR/AcrR family transcriptional regulator [Granulicella sp. WH15]QHN03976.1 TetR/AcrR family transcriptional regulator [Granulicella sp. WH15]